MKAAGHHGRGRRGGGYWGLARWLIILALGLAVPAAGLLWFAVKLPAEAPGAEEATDAIVVLTGGQDRLTSGLDLLAQGAAPKLFVSGVYRGVEVGELLSLSQRDPENLECCIALGYEADDTRGNALETAEWMRAEGFDSLRLVTAVYHMPRSLLEFQRAMPDKRILPHPVFPPGFRHDAWWRSPRSISLLARECAKYLLAAIRGGPPGGAAEGVPR